MSYKRERMGRANETHQQRMMRIERVKMRAYGEESSSMPPSLGSFRRRRIDKGIRYTLLSFVIIAAAAVVIKVLNPSLQVAKPFSMFFMVFGGCMLMSFVTRRMRR